MKLKTVYICQKCEYQSPKWLGKCPQCNSWSSFNEDVINIGKDSRLPLSRTPRILKEVAPLGTTNKKDDPRIKTNINELDRVLGDGFVKGSLTLLGGEPGIGKSTLTLQLADNIAKERKILLASGEESVEQIENRAERLNLKNPQNIIAINDFSLENILYTTKDQKADFLIVDSIQVISSEELPASPGSIAQVRYCAEKLMEYAKSTNTTVILISHVTKEGNLAGPKVLEHLVDTVLLIEGDRFQQFRLLKSSKNRFGSCNEVGIFEMDEKGLKEVKNPSQQLLSGRKENSIGSVITAALEGTRVFLIEVQALTSTSVFGYPKRTANGFDLNRLQIIIAVLEKHCRVNLQNQDVFVNIVGGIKLNEPAADLAVALAIASSFSKKALTPDTIVFGEIGLSGELRKVNYQEKRSNEAKKLELKNIISPDQFSNLKDTLSNILK